MKKTIQLNKQNPNFPMEKESLYIKGFDFFDVTDLQKIGQPQAIANYYGNSKYGIAEANINKSKKNTKTYGHYSFKITGQNFVNDNDVISFSIIFH